MGAADQINPIIVGCGQERAEEVHRLTQLAFAPYQSLDPPSSAGRESLADVVADLRAGGGAIAQLEGRTVGCLRWQLETDGEIYFRRVAVVPKLQSRGIGRALMTWAEDEARRRVCRAITVGVRVALPANRTFFEGLGYVVVEQHNHDGYDHPTWLKMRKDLGVEKSNYST